MEQEGIIEQKYAEAVRGIREDWLLVPSTHWYEYINGLSISLKTAYLVVVVHNQVMNGGFHQYFFNGYGQFAKETVESLNIIDSPVKADLLKQALSLVNNKNYEDGKFREELLNKRIKTLIQDSFLEETLRKLDRLYYKDESEDIHDLLEKYLNSAL